MRFFICNHCGNIIAMVKDSGISIQCCGEEMEEIIPGTSDGAQEKHVPVYNVNGETVTVSVGAAEHPMTSEHYIEWVCVESEEGLQFKKLNSDASPRVSFSLSKGDKVKAVYAFCNLHSLWKA
ncbi:MAG: desulfoferrodoxin [Clostridia bacterium]|nr:desulfoferrodoxin [Clostridia bacterium]